MLFTIMLGGIVVLGILSYLTRQKSIHSSRLVADTYQVIDQADKYLLKARDVIYQNNLYILTGDTANRAFFNESKIGIDTLLLSLKALVADNPSQVRRLDSLNAVMDSLLAFVNKSAELKSAHPEAMVNARSHFMEGRVFRDQVTGLINQFKSEESRILDLRESQAKQTVSTFNQTLIALLTGIFILLVIVILVIRHNLNRLYLAEERLQMSNERFTRLFRLSPLPAFLTDMDSYRIVQVNEEFERILGKKNTEVTGRSLVEVDLVDSQTLQRIQHAIQETGRVNDLEITILPAGDFPRSVLLSADTILIETLTYCFITMIDITGRKEAEQIIKESEERIRLLIDSVRDYAIFMIDKTGHILNWNQGAASIKGYSAEEVIGKHISLFYTEEEKQLGLPEKNLERAEKNGRVEIEGWRVKKDGTRFWADIVISAIYDKAGNLKGYTKVTRDNTARKAATEELQLALTAQKELNELKSNFVSIASHEFRTPLSAILSSVSLMEHYRTTEEQPKRDRHLSRIRNSIQTLTSILNDFLSLGKIEEGKVNPVPEQVNMRSLIEDTCSEMRIMIKPGQVLHYSHEGPAEFLTDKGFVNQILLNLISNAIKYSKEEAQIHVFSRIDLSGMELCVQDEGIGISEEDQKHLFERFYRASNATGIQGTGLGLHIIRRYVQMLGGTIGLTSTLGKGSRFTVHIPYAD
ncbi:MAG TPA: PAS domain S-box protein [Chitinophagaceae bacterium]|nr:PAS domain S-box protein [Chitinophagaceae bacterium]